MTLTIVATTASTEFSGSFNAAKAFDKNAATSWTTSGAATGWVRAELSAAATLTSYAVYGLRVGAPTRSPKNWTFEGSNDGTSWTVLDTQINQTWVSGEIKSYSFTNSTAYLYYRLNVSANSGDSLLNVVDVFLGLSIIGVTASSEFTSGGAGLAVNAIDGSLSTTWNTASSFLPSSWLRVQLTEAYALTQYRVGSWNSASGPARAPKDWTLEGSNDGSSWTTLHTVTGETGWASAGEYRTFNFANSTAYLYYRILVTANNGDGYLAIAELSPTLEPVLGGSGSLTLSGAMGAAVPEGGTGSIALAGTMGASAAPTMSGSITFDGTGGTTAPEEAAGTATLTLAGTMGAATPAGATGTITLTGTGAGSVIHAAGGTGHLELEGTPGGVIAAAYYPTDISNIFDGLDLVMVATITVTRARPAIPPRLTPADKWDVALPYPPPVLVKGRVT